MHKFLVKFISFFYFAPRKRAINIAEIIYAQSILKDGDVICSFTQGELTNLFIQGKFKHVGMYAGNCFVVEAIKNGVESTMFYSFCANKDKIAILRPKFGEDHTGKLARNHALSQIGVPYDYKFEPNEKAFYCAELVWWAYQKATGGNSPFIRRKIFGVETVYPSDFYNAHDKFELVLELPKN